jgi:hypothetical protein
MEHTELVSTAVKWIHSSRPGDKCKLEQSGEQHWWVVALGRPNLDIRIWDLEGVDESKKKQEQRKPA